MQKLKTSIKRPFGKTYAPNILFFFFFLILFISSKKASAQNQDKKQEIITSEISFAEDAKAKGIPFAFINHLDTSGMIVNGNHIINGRKAYTKAKPNEHELLSWRPAFAYINKMNDFGFTSGPYLYYANKEQEPIAAGFYFSIWKKNSAGIYKVIFDGGVNHNMVSDELKEMMKLDLPKTECYVRKLKNPSVFSNKQISSPLVSKEIMNLKDYFANKCLILRPNQDFITTASNYVSPQPSYSLDGLTKKELGNGCDKTISMYYCYGNINRQKVGEKDKSLGFYVTVWEKQVNDWKVIADIIQFDKH